jgi:hypothetical protein
VIGATLIVFLVSLVSAVAAAIARFAWLAWMLKRRHAGSVSVAIGLLVQPALIGAFLGFVLAVWWQFGTKRP